MNDYSDLKLMAECATGFADMGLAPDVVLDLIAAHDELADLRARLAERDALLKLARQFVVNGIDLGYIRMPDADTPDPAHDLVPMIDAALSAAQCSEVDPQCSEVLRTQGGPVERKRHVARTDAVFDASWIGEKLPVPKCMDALQPVAVVNEFKPCDKHAWQHYPGRDLDYCIFCYERRGHVVGFDGLICAEEDALFLEFRS